MSCSHCGQSVESGWEFDDLLLMVADGAYPPGVCGWCWHRVSASQLDIRCDSAGACTHVVRDIP